MNTIRAVPRTYRNVKFRSTLEADWAATLDALGIAWQYEPEAVQLPSGVLYRPDFYLPECTTWLEVKGPHNDRIEKTHELGEAAAHYPDCDSIAHESDITLSAHSDEEWNSLGRVVAGATSGNTRVTIEQTEWTGAAERGLRTVRTARMKRHIALDQATIAGLSAAAKFNPWWPCCRGNNVPWRLVVIGRASQAGAAVWESAQPLDVWLIKCEDCEQHSFFDSTMQWVCRRCQSGGKVYRGGYYESGHLSMATILPWVRA